MPVIRSAKKKLRVDKRREFSNKKYKLLIQSSIKKAEKSPTVKNVQTAVKSIDKGVKNKILHKNKASRLKSRLSKLISEKKVSKQKETVPPKVKKAKK